MIFHVCPATCAQEIEEREEETERKALEREGSLAMGLGTELQEVFHRI